MIAKNIRIERISELFGANFIYIGMLVLLYWEIWGLKINPAVNLKNLCPNINKINPKILNFLSFH